MECPSDTELLAFIEGQLDDRLARRADEHLDSCPSCLAVVAALARGSDAGTNTEAPGLPSAPRLPSGEPRYELGKEIARGGMGRVVAARDHLLDRDVALKLLHTPDPLLAMRLVRERQITARLSHPAIMPIYDAGTLDNGEPFFAMRLVKGESLDHLITRATQLEQRLDLVPAVIAVVDAIGYAHDEGVIHRDLKPHNIVVGPFDEVVVLDWGLARCHTDEHEPPGAPAVPSDAALSRAGDVLGTFGYMAPEQAVGATVDPRTDIYGLGAILYHLLAGGPPHDITATTASPRGRQQPVQPLATRVPDAPADLIAIATRAMASDPAQRYATAGDLADELRRWQAARPAGAHVAAPTQQPRRAVAWLTVIAAILTIGLATGALLWSRRTSDSRTAATPADAPAASATAPAPPLAASDAGQPAIRPVGDQTTTAAGTKSPPAHRPPASQLRRPTPPTSHQATATSSPTGTGANAAPAPPSGKSPGVTSTLVARGCPAKFASSRVMVGNTSSLAIVFTDPDQPWTVRASISFDFPPGFSGAIPKVDRWADNGLRKIVAVTDKAHGSWGNHCWSDGDGPTSGTANISTLDRATGKVRATFDGFQLGSCARKLTGTCTLTGSIESHGTGVFE